MTDTIRIFRYEVPVDDCFHEFALSGNVVRVGCRDPRVVEFWALNRENGPTLQRGFIVVGTGHPFPPHAVYVGSAVAPGGSLVWHLLEHKVVGS